MIWPSSSCAFDFHLQSTVMISSSPAWHHDLHHLELYQCVVTWLSRQQLLLQLLLSRSGQVKKVLGACILCNREITIRLLPVADNFNKTWSSHTKTYISSRLDHITSQHALQKQVRRPLLCCCKFYVAGTGRSKNRSYLHIKTTMIVFQVVVVLTFARIGCSHTRFN